jgi:hypothetical protein
VEYKHDFTVQDVINGTRRLYDVPVLERSKLQPELRDAWIETYSGKIFHILKPKPDEVDIDDIAHALSNTCRFGGHCKVFHSVAEHSVLVSYMTKNPLEGLLHDASEAYITDLPSPVKHQLPDYKNIETGIMKVICKKFGLEYPLSPDVKDADVAQLKTEARNLLKSRGESWTDNWRSDRPYGMVPKGWSPTLAKQNFLGRFRELYQ